MLFMKMFVIKNYVDCNSNSINGVICKKEFFRILITSIILFNIQIQWMFEKNMIFYEFKATSKKSILIFFNKLNSF